MQRQQIVQIEDSLESALQRLGITEQVYENYKNHFGKLITGKKKLKGYGEIQKVVNWAFDTLSSAPCALADFLSVTNNASFTLLMALARAPEEFDPLYAKICRFFKFMDDQTDEKDSLLINRTNYREQGEVNVLFCQQNARSRLFKLQALVDANVDVSIPDKQEPPRAALMNLLHNELASGSRYVSDSDYTARELRLLIVHSSFNVVKEFILTVMFKLAKTIQKPDNISVLAHAVYSTMDDKIEKFLEQEKVKIQNLLKILVLTVSIWQDRPNFISFWRQLLAQEVALDGHQENFVINHFTLLLCTGLQLGQNIRVLLKKPIKSINFEKDLFIEKKPTIYTFTEQIPGEIIKINIAYFLMLKSCKIVYRRLMQEHIDFAVNCFGLVADTVNNQTVRQAGEALAEAKTLSEQEQRTLKETLLLPASAIIRDLPECILRIQGLVQLICEYLSATVIYQEITSIAARPIPGHLLPKVTAPAIPFDEKKPKAKRKLTSVDHAPVVDLQQTAQSFLPMQLMPVLDQTTAAARLVLPQQTVSKTHYEVSTEQVVNVSKAYIAKLEQQIKDSYEVGYNAGFKAGYDKGFNQGFDKRRDEEEKAFMSSPPIPALKGPSFTPSSLAQTPPYHASWPIRSEDKFRGDVIENVTPDTSTPTFGPEAFLPPYPSSRRTSSSTPVPGLSSESLAVPMNLSSFAHSQLSMWTKSSSSSSSSSSSAMSALSGDVDPKRLRNSTSRMVSSAQSSMPVLESGSDPFATFADFVLR